MRIHRLAAPGERREAVLDFFQTRLARSETPGERPAEDSSKQEVSAE